MSIDTRSELSSAIEREYEEYHRNLPGPKPWQMTPEQIAMTAEEREAAHRRYSAQVDIRSAIEYVFREVIDHAPTARYLLALPSVMARDMELGSNTLLRYVLNLAHQETISVEDEATILEVRSLIAKPRHDAGIREVIGIMLRNDRSEGCYTLGEFYWLYQLCDWLGCLEGITVSHFSRLTGSHGEHVSNLDFRSPIKEDSQQMKEIVAIMRHQYAQLEKVLSRL